MRSLPEIEKKVPKCRLCPRLREHCQEIAHKKRKAYQDDQYWGKPISGFGDHKAEVVFVGLAPGAHGANRTGRVFTGDQSGLWLYRALHRFGFANRVESKGPDDGLKLKNAYITCVVKCAPPQNKPNTQEIQNCRPFLEGELGAFNHAKVWVALGRLAYEQLGYLFELKRPLPKFSHGKVVKIDSNRSILLSFHPSQQNTFTKRLTEPMFDQIFQKARELIES